MPRLPPLPPIPPRTVIATKGNLDVLSCGHAVPPNGQRVRPCPTCEPVLRKARLVDLIPEGSGPHDPVLPAEFGRI